MEFRRVLFRSCGARRHPAQRPRAATLEQLTADVGGCGLANERLHRVGVARGLGGWHGRGRFDGRFAARTGGERQGGSNCNPANVHLSSPFPKKPSTGPARIRSEEHTYELTSLM